ncbi:MAG: hypothetical protein QOH88_438 [Verrucomicrobiota bacterium]|jgi:hypothetical protein
MRRREYHDGDAVVNFMDCRFESDLRKAKLPTFPDQRKLKTSQDAALWMLWVMRDYFGHHSPMYASELAHLLELRGIAVREDQLEQLLMRAGKKIMRKRYDETSTELAYMIAEKGVAFLQAKYSATGVRAIIIDGTQPWRDRHVTLPTIAEQLSGRICVVDKYYGRGTLAVLYHFRHGSPLQFLTARTSETAGAFARELRDFKRESPTLEVRIFPDSGELHDRYIISEHALIIVGHGIKDIGTKESFLIFLEGDSTSELRQTLLEKFNHRWSQSYVPT